MGAETTQNYNYNAIRRIGAIATGCLGFKSVGVFILNILNAARRSGEAETRRRSLFFAPFSSPFIRLRNADPFNL